jgi:adenylylsulfate kinase-like enzyme
MFHECQRWNREHITFYKEIYIQVPIEVLISRDQKQLYSRALSGEIQDVMGIDIEIEEPESPDLTIYNSGDVSPEILIEKYFENLTGIKEKSRP